MKVELENSVDLCIKVINIKYRIILDEQFPYQIYEGYKPILDFRIISVNPPKRHKKPMSLGAFKKRSFYNSRLFVNLMQIDKGKYFSRP